MTDAKAKAKPCGKLYYTPTSCGAASFIAAHIAGLKLETEQVDLKTHKTASDVDFYTINPKGNVPTLVLADGTVLNENVATLQAIADQNLSAKLAPPWGTHHRYQLVNLLAWIASELHPSIGGLFSATSDDVKTALKARAAKCLTYFDTKLLAGKKEFLCGDHLTIADLYSGVVLNWTQWTGIDLKPYPAVAAFLKRVQESEQVVAAQKLMATKPSSIN